MSGILEFQTDLSDAFRAARGLHAIPKAAKKLLSMWAATTVTHLKQSASDMKKSGTGRKTSQMGRSVSFQVDPSEGVYKVVIGTNLAGAGVSSKYARIQDQGGVTHPTVTPKMRKWAWFMYRKEQGAQAREIRKMLPGLSRAKVRETARMGASKYLGIALTKKAKLDVKVPASHWFTRVIERRGPALDSMMAETAVLKEAENMAAGGNS